MNLVMKKSRMSDATRSPNITTRETEIEHLKLELSNNRFILSMLEESNGQKDQTRGECDSITEIQTKITWIEAQLKALIN